MSALVRAGQFCFRYRGYLLPIAVLLLFIPGPALFGDPLVAGTIGLVIALLGQLLRVATIGLAYIIRGGRNHQVYAEDLVTQGLYSHCRNPMYVANFFLTLGLGFTSNSLVFLVSGLLISAAMHYAIVAAEEDFLSKKFGEEYERYRNRVPRWHVRLAGLLHTVRTMRFDWHRVLVKEYASSFDWLSAAALLVIVNLILHEDLSRGWWLTVPAVLIIVVRVA